MELNGTITENRVDLDGTISAKKTLSGSLSRPGRPITVDDALSDTSENPVQNKVVTAALGNKLSTNGNAYRSASIPMGHLDSTSTATVMTATVDGITELRDGVCVWLRNGVITSASGFTLNVNGLGAKPCYSSLAAASRSTTIFNVNYTMLFVYNEERVDGGCWDVVYGVDTNTTYTPPKLGFGYGTCTTAAATVAKVASISSYTLVAGGIVAIKFDNDVPAGATLNISSKGAKAIYYKGAAITAGVIQAGDTVTMIYSTYYHVLSIDRLGSDITIDDALSATSENPVQNKVVKAALDSKGTYSKPSGGIPASDLASGVIPTVPTKTSDLTNDSGYVSAAGAAAAAPVQSVNGQTGAVTVQAATDAQVSTAVNTWLDANVAQETGYVLDSSLTMSNAAAPADKVGELKEEIDGIASLSDSVQIPFSNGGTNHYILHSDGTVSSGTSSDFSYTDYVDVSSYSIVLYKRSKHTIANPAVGMAFYDENKTYISGVQAAGNQSAKGYESQLYSVAVPTNAKYARFSYYLNTATYGEFEICGEPKIVNSVNAVASLKKALTEKLTLKQPINLCRSDSDWTTGAYVDNGSGAITSNSALSYSAKMPVNEGDVIRLYDFYGGTFEWRQIRSVAAYDANQAFVQTSDALGWKVASYTVPAGVAYIILSAPTASQYMVVANTTVSAYEAWFEPYYVATYDFVKDAIEQGSITTQNIKNGFACALPKTKFRQTVGIPCTWYKSSMATPSSIYAYVNAGYSRTTNGDETFSYNTSNADATNNGYVWYEYDPFMNLLYKFDNNTGYGAPTVVKALNLSDCSLLAIGDSTVDHDTMTAKLLSYFTENGHTITLLGTLGSQSDPLNKNEGRAGWTTANYLANTTKNGYTNPFWNPTAEKFDFSYYMAQQGYSGVDFVVIQLGINDLYPTDPRGISTPNYSAIWANIRTMIDSIHEYNTATKIIINLPTTPNSNPEAHSTSEAIYQNFVINYNEYALNAMLSISENYVRASYCHLILDPATEIRDNVHPTVGGYEKMALEVINQINCWQNGV